MPISTFIAAFIMGLLGSAHCMGMCGGITIALNNSVAQDKKVSLALVYQIFRVISYSMLGALVAVVGYVFDKWSDLPILMIISGLLLIMMGLYLFNWWNLLIGLEKIGRALWTKIQPLQKQFLPIRHWSQSMMIGLLWGFLPCGLVYTALALASTSANPLAGFITMLCFGLGTLPALLAAGIFSQKLIQLLKKTWLRRSLAIIFIIAGLFQIYSSVFGHHNHAGHMFIEKSASQDEKENDVHQHH